MLIFKTLSSAVVGTNFPQVLKTHIKTGDNTELHIRAKMINFSLVAHMDIKLSEIYHISN